MLLSAYPHTLMAASGGREDNSHAARWCLSVEFVPVCLMVWSDLRVATFPRTFRCWEWSGVLWSEFDTKTPSSCMAVALMTATDSHERMRLGTQQHLPTSA